MAASRPFHGRLAVIVVHLVMSTQTVAAEIVLEGRVQGVGFRSYAQHRGSLLGLAGYVMNLKDGRLRVHAEGSREMIEDLAHDLEKGPPLAQVERISLRWLSPTGRFHGFGVRYAEFEP